MAQRGSTNKMSPEQLQSIIDALTQSNETTIKAVVNGKIDKLNAQVNSLSEDFKIYVITDTRDKDDLKIQIQDLSNDNTKYRASVASNNDSVAKILNFSSSTVTVFKVIGLIAGAILSVWAVIKLK